MKARRRSRRSKSRRNRTVPPPLPLCLEFVDELIAGNDSEEWMTVDECELIPLSRPEPISAEVPFPLVTFLTPEDNVSNPVPEPPHVPERKWIRYAAMLVAALLAAGATMLPMRWPRLAGPVLLTHTKPIESITYVVPVTVVGDARAAVGNAQRELGPE